MESINKFKVLTVVILCLFIFCIAAIYTNTKDESSKKGNPPVQIDRDFRANNERNLNDIAIQMDIVNKRLDDMTERINAMNSKPGEVKCKIYGTMSYDGITKMSPTDAYDDAKSNGSALILTCSP